MLWAKAVLAAAAAATIVAGGFDRASKSSSAANERSAEPRSAATRKFSAAVSGLFNPNCARKEPDSSPMASRIAQAYCRASTNSPTTGSESLASAAIRREISEMSLMTIVTALNQPSVSLRSRSARGFAASAVI